MQHEIIFELGDWSKDGHNQSDKYKIKSNKPVEELRELHFKFCEQHFKIGDMCREHEERDISDDIKLGLDSLNISYKNFEEDTGMGTEQLLIIWLDCLKYIDNTFEYCIIEDDTPTIHFYGFDSKGRHLDVPGYGFYFIKKGKVMRYTKTIEYICYNIDTIEKDFNNYLAKYYVNICVSSNVLGMCKDFLSSEVVNNFLSIFNNTAIYNDVDYIDFVNTNYVKNIRFPFKITNETLSLYLLLVLSKIIEATDFKNYNGKVHIESVKVYKNNISSAEACYEDLKNTKLIDYYLDQVVLSEGIISRCFNDHSLYYKLSNCNYDKNEKVFTITKDGVYDKCNIISNLQKININY